MARKARWLGLLAAYRELDPHERSAVNGFLQRDSEARDLKQRFDQQDALLASLDVPSMDPAITERIMAATVARGDAVRQAGWRPVLSAALALLLLIMVGGTALASSGSLPGDALYPVKRVGEEVRLALTLGDKARAQYADRLGEVRRQEVHTLLDLGRAGTPVEFEGPLEHSPTGEWMVAGVPILLPNEVDETPTISGSPVHVMGEIEHARVRVRTMRPLTSSAATAPGAAEPQPTGAEGTPTGAGRASESPSRGPASASPQGGDEPSNAQATSTPPATRSATPPPSATADGGYDKPKDSPADGGQPTRPRSPSEDKARPTAPAPRPKQGEETGPATGSQMPSISGQSPATTPPGTVTKPSHAHPQPGRQPSHVPPPGQQGSHTAPSSAPAAAGNTPRPPEGSAPRGSPATPSSANGNPTSPGRP